MSSTDAATHIVCANCDATVKVPAQRLADQPRCPKCHQPLFAGAPIELRAENFDRHIERNDVPVIVDFWAPWCGPCKMMAPTFAEAARRREPHMRFAKVNSDEAPQLSARFGIRGIPTLIVFRGGREIARQSGAMDGATLARWLDAVVR